MLKACYNNTIFGLKPVVHSSFPFVRTSIEHLAKWHCKRGNTADSTTFSRFTGILVDDKSVDPSSYAADPGSLNVSLRPDFLETLSVGEHTITAVFDDGRADAGFTIVKKTSGSSSSTKKRSSGSSSGTRSSSGNSGSGGKKGPMTGDTAPVAMWAAIAAAAAAGIGILVFLRRKTKHV